MTTPNEYIVSDTEISRREFLLHSAGTFGALAVGRVNNSQQFSTLKTGSTVKSSPELYRSQEQSAEKFLKLTAESLINLHEDAPNGEGWRFKSEIQRPHYQTDRDVGAAGIGMGFLAMAKNYPGEPKWLDAAIKTAQWLSSVAIKDKNGGLSWPDYQDDHDVSSSMYTSFDDGAIGIGDFFWQLYEQTNDPSHANTAKQAVEWTLSQAEATKHGYRWKWDTTAYSPIYYMGMGEGMAGIIHTLATFYDRTKHQDPQFAAKCKLYMNGALGELAHVKTALADDLGDSRASRALPETGVIGQDGDTSMNSGYLSGAAGEAFMYLKMYEVFKDKKYLHQADKAFSWLQDSKNGPFVHGKNGTVAWKLMIDPQGGNNTKYATGIEEGAAGIGWVYLQAFNLTKNDKYLTLAKKSADWLLLTAAKDKIGGLSWPEDEHPVSKLVHPNLDNGAAGIGMFLQDLYLITKDPRYNAGAKRALSGIMSRAIKTGSNISWRDSDNGAPFAQDPSWHWGTAGILAYIVRMNGGKTDIPGEQLGLMRKR